MKRNLKKKWILFGIIASIAVLGVLLFQFIRISKEEIIDQKNIAEKINEPAGEEDAITGNEPLPVLPGKQEESSLFGGGGGGGGKGAPSEGGEESVSVPEEGCNVALNYGVNEHGTSTNVDDEVFVIVMNNNNNPLTGEVIVDGISEGSVSVNPLASAQKLSSVMTSWLTALQGSNSKSFTVQLEGACSAQISASISYTQNEEPLD